MKRIPFVQLLVVVFVVCQLVAILPTQAQIALAESFVSSDGALTFEYPTGWIAEENDLIPGLIIVRSEEIIASAQSLDDPRPEPGVLSLFIINPKAFEVWGSVPASLDEMLTLMMAQAETKDEATQFSQPQPLLLNGHYATHVFTSNSVSEGAILVIDIDGKYVAMQSNVAPGEYNQFMDSVLAIANTLDYSLPEGMLTFEGSGLSFNYPANWFSLAMLGVVHVSNASGDELTPGRFFMSMMLTDLGLDGREGKTTVKFGDIFAITGESELGGETTIIVDVEGNILAEFSADTLEAWIQHETEFGGGLPITSGGYDGVLLEFTGNKSEGILIVLSTDQGSLLVIAVTNVGEFVSFESEIMALVDSIALLPGE